MDQIAATVFLVLFLCLTHLPNDAMTAPSNMTTSIMKPIECHTDEVSTDCVSCIPTCERLFPGICDRSNCKPGCKCKLGYFKDSDDDCVSIIGCIIDNIRRERPWSITDFLHLPQKNNN